MSGSDPVGTDVDPVQSAMEYRNRLKAELAMVEAFLTMAEELSSQNQLVELDAWLCNETEAPSTLH